MSVFQRHSKKTLFLSALVGIFLVLAILEISLRWAGFVPGFVGARPGEYLDLNLVDTLETYDWLYTDSNGIFKANPKTIHDGFPPQLVINADGFRDRELVDCTGKGKKVMLIGDSFTWGNLADVGDCFAGKIGDVYERTYNLGMPGTEPNQYAKLAQLYVPKLKPDIVCVAFYMANDIMWWDYPLKPFENKYFITNAGWLSPFIDGDFIPSGQATYDYYMKKYTLPNQDISGFNSFCAKTVIGTKLWLALLIVDWAPEAYDPEVTRRWKKHESQRLDKPVSYKYLKQIAEECEQNNAEFYLFAIPNYEEIGKYEDDFLKDVFGDLKYYLPDNLTADDYAPWPDGHFNKQGHAKFAEYMLSTIE